MMVPPGLGHKDFGALFYARTTAEYGTAVAVDANKDGKTVKAYFWPSLTANELLQVEPTFDFLDEASERWGIKINLFSIDCLNPRDARIKIYVSSPWTSREFVMDALTLGGRVPVADDSALASLTALWDTFLGDAPDRLSDELLAKSTPGFYLTLGNGGVKSAKMYMSPQHWCTTDEAALLKLRQYFASQQQSDNLMNKYESAIRQVL